MKVKDTKVDKVLANAIIPSKAALALTEAMERIYNTLGKPTYCMKEGDNSDVGWKMCDELVELWYTFYPWELKAWKSELIDELDAERSVRASIDAGGYFPISYPTRLAKMLETYLPDQKLQDKTFIKKMVKRHPVFKMTNFKI